MSVWASRTVLPRSDSYRALPTPSPSQSAVGLARLGSMLPHTPPRAYSMGSVMQVPRRWQHAHHLGRLISADQLAPDTSVVAASAANSWSAALRLLRARRAAVTETASSGCGGTLKVGIWHRVPAARHCRCKQRRSYGRARLGE
jgi:hypothetical protein